MQNAIAAQKVGNQDFLVLSISALAPDVTHLYEIQISLGHSLLLDHGAPLGLPGSHFVAGTAIRIL